MKASFNINDLLVLLVIVIWGANNALMKLALAEIPLISFVGLRLISASIILFALLALSAKGLRISRGDLGRLSMIGFFGYTLFHPMFAAGLHYSTATDCALIMGTGPLFGGVIALSMGIERLTVRIIVGILISLFGVLVIVAKDLSGTLDIATRLGGNLILLAGVIFLSLSTVLGK
ncbi:MAG: DMT family transporter, partial [Deltaproteobacteria bacterium]|nr:DMT family transporter [Deltaproteobacteria bacterium]